LNVDVRKHKECPKRRRHNNNNVATKKKTKQYEMQLQMQMKMKRDKQWKKHLDNMLAVGFDLDTMMRL
jgi:hypothetical protein